MISPHLVKPVMILGYGSTLWGDCGFGPAVINSFLRNFPPPDYVLAINAGGDGNEYFADLLTSPIKPQKLFLIMTLCNKGRCPGELRVFDSGNLPPITGDAHFLHQWPSIDLLSKISSQSGIAVRIITVQAGYIPKIVWVGLSPAVAQAVEPAKLWLRQQIGESKYRSDLCAGCMAKEYNDAPTMGAVM